MLISKKSYWDTRRNTCSCSHFVNDELKLKDREIKLKDEKLKLKDEEIRLLKEEIKNSWQFLS